MGHPGLARSTDSAAQWIHRGPENKQRSPSRSTVASSFFRPIPKGSNK
jgi:hypothetical protein